VTIEEGARVKMSRELADDESWARGPLTSHGMFTVDSVEIPGKTWEPEPGDIDVAFVEGSDERGNYITVPLDAVEVVMTAGEMARRKLPTAAEIAAEVAGEILGSHDTFELDEVDYGANDGTFEAYGRTHDGLGLAFQVQISGVWETDL